MPQYIDSRIENCGVQSATNMCNSLVTDFRNFPCKQNCLRLKEIALLGINKSFLVKEYE